MTDVTVIGLGQMGTRLAELMLDADSTVTVWNRSREKAEDLALRGAVPMSDPAAAIGASPVTLICVSDDSALLAILERPGIAGALQGRVLVNLGTGSPEGARAIDTLIASCGGRYLDGAIQTAPSQMGQPDTPILLSGDPQLYEELKPLLAILGGGIVHVGDAIDASAFMDLATLSYVYGSIAGFLHGAQIAEAKGISTKAFGSIVKAISPSFGAFLEHEGRVIASEDYAVTESPMRISVSALERILRNSETLGINTELPELVNAWLARAEAAGLADEELAALIKVLRQTVPA